MREENWLICGTRTKILKGYKELVFKEIDKAQWDRRAIFKDWKPSSIIEGCCPDSADAYAEEWAKENEVEIQHHPSTSGNYLTRNIEMVKKANLVIAFWDGYSYGTAHTIAWATKRNIPVIIILIREAKE
jgi:hypothetical protein